MQHQRYFPTLKNLLAKPRLGSGAAARSGNDEWGTPAEIVTAVYLALGDIDLDPASTDLANQTVQAHHYYTLDDDGLSQPWFGRVFLNPPYSGRSSKRLFLERLERCRQDGSVDAAVVLVSSDLASQWADPIRRSADAVCIFARRLRFYSLADPSVTMNSVSSVVAYFGPDPLRFRRAFDRFGTVFAPVR